MKKESSMPTLLAWITTLGLFFYSLSKPGIPDLFFQLGGFIVGIGLLLTAAAFLCIFGILFYIGR